MSTRFPFLHPLLCIICPYPFAIPFVFKLCKTFSSLTVVSYHSSTQFCSRPQTHQRTETFQEQCYFLYVTALGRGKWPKRPLKLSCTIRMFYFQIFLLAFCNQCMRTYTVLKSWVFSLKVHYAFSNWPHGFSLIDEYWSIAIKNLVIHKNSFNRQHKIKIPKKILFLGVRIWIIFLQTFKVSEFTACLLVS